MPRCIRFLWLAAVGLACWWGLPAAGALAETSTEYSAIFIGGKKVGYEEQTRLKADDKVTHTITTVMALGRGKVVQKTRTIQTTVETAGGKPLSFRVIETGQAVKSVDGTIKDGKLTLTLTEAGSTKTAVQDWPEGAVLHEGAMILMKAKGLKEGTKYSYKQYAPDALGAWDTEVAVGAAKDVDILGKTERLIEIGTVQTMAGRARLSATMYVDEQLTVRKAVIPVLGMSLEVVACARALAMGKNDEFNITQETLVQCPGPLRDYKQAGSIAYSIKPTGTVRPEFPQTDSQKVTTAEDGTIVVTVTPLALPKGQTIPYAGQDKALLAATQQARYLQCEDKKVQELTREALGDTKDAAVAAKKLEWFVRRYITAKDLSAPYDSAAQVAQTQRGDCKGHAALLAAMCRAAGIPAKVAWGIAYRPSIGDRQHVLGGHAWVTARIGGKWVDLDAALDGFDAGHIALGAGDGDPIGFFDVLSTLGNFRIVKVEMGK
ncbi:MAG: transglutaminase family protein [Phycisphaerae bacterium]